MYKVSLRDQNNEEITSFVVETTDIEKAFQQGKRTANLLNDFNKNAIDRQVYGVFIDGKYKDLGDL